jgi:hypothetical protein
VTICPKVDTTPILKWLKMNKGYICLQRVATNAWFTPGPAGHITARRYKGKIACGEENCTWHALSHCGDNGTLSLSQMPSGTEHESRCPIRQLEVYYTKAKSEIARRCEEN